MVERLLFNGIDIDGYGVSVDKAAQLTFMVQSRTALAALFGFYDASLCAEEAFYYGRFPAMPFFAECFVRAVALAASRVRLRRGYPVARFWCRSDQGVRPGFLRRKKAGQDTGVLRRDLCNRKSRQASYPGR